MKVKTNKYKLFIEDKTIKIYINDTLHLFIRADQLLGIQSWIEGYDKQKYYIEFVMKNGTVSTTYDDIDKWKSILDLLDKHSIRF